MKLWNWIKSFWLGDCIVCKQFAPGRMRHISNRKVCLFCNLPPECSKCHNTEWNHHPIPLANYKNELLCANCLSQIETNWESYFHEIV